MSVKRVFDLIEQHKVKFVDLRMTDVQGKEHHVTLHVDQVKGNKDFFTEGKMFDGSSLKGFKDKQIDKSDMMLMPDPSTAVMDKFCEQPTLNLRCDVLEPSTMRGFNRDPRTIAARAEDYLKSTGIATAFNVGAENEFFIFEAVRFHTAMNRGFYEVESHEGSWSATSEYKMGHRPGTKGGYFPVSPVDSAQDLRSVMCGALEEMGLSIEVHHHEVAPAQHEIATRYNTLVKKADEVQILKYVVHNVAHSYGKTATFMPKPLVGDNGSGMHCHLSLMQDKVNIFAGDGYAGLSEQALFFIGGVIKHAQALNAFTNATTNSYKRLVPGFEAPVLLAYSARNRSAAIRIPHVINPKGRRIEVRFPDSTCNPYLAFSALLLAGLDGIQHRIHPGDPMNKDLYDLPPEEEKRIPHVATSLENALSALAADQEFLKQGGVFSQDFLEAYIQLKQAEVLRYNTTTHPVEFEMYYSL
jgi:glutamine synthetase